MLLFVTHWEARTHNAGGERERGGWGEWAQALENGNLGVPAWPSAASGDHSLEGKGAIVSPAP